MADTSSKLNPESHLLLVRPNSRPTCHDTLVANWYRTNRSSASRTSSFAKTSKLLKPALSETEQPF
jgi:hypothetical protein